MLGYFNYTVVATYACMLSGAAGIYLAYAQRPFWALVCLMFSGVLDMFDGKIARRAKNRNIEEERFGIQIDSLSDVICFGVLPAVICFQTGTVYWFLKVIPALYMLAALIRLAYFNVTEEIRQDNTDAPRTSYTGVPVTTAALVFPLVYTIGKRCGGQVLKVALLAFLALLGVLFLSKLKIKKPHGLGQVIMALVGVSELALLIVYGR
jgi:CDP-diacylglycerol--serine O-phosphatidyltransferase